MENRRRKRLVVILAATVIIICALISAAAIVKCSNIPEEGTVVKRSDAPVSMQEKAAASVLPIWSCYIIAGCSAIVIVLLSVSIAQGSRKKRKERL